MSAGTTPRELPMPGRGAHGPVGLQALLDLLVGVYQEFQSSPFAREKLVSGFLMRTVPLVRQVKKLRIQREDFDILKVIGRGTFSEVAVASMSSTQQVYALKIMNKDIKPDNILLMAEGHVRLGDFGSCLRLQKDRMETLCHVMDRVPAGVHLAFVGFSYTATR
ncbi:hypothetical protein SKAU_G00089530 [Synaphobranchus kaupii]|uniref:Protein kinase domain-containing protein n=1 Tax=Synaphobranchus kaupii TaxID=118154 RepID=A0A9Q1J461_SYNKA|nr:hypothetical protein SKAU_G00089530 [Synaphobranchus kaupii]